MLQKKLKQTLLEEIPPGFKLLHKLRVPEEVIFTFEWSPDGRIIALGSVYSANYSTISLWDSETGKLRSGLKGHSFIVHTLAWSPDGRILASGSKDNSIRLWEIGTGKLRQMLKGSSSHITSIAWSPSSKILASNSKDASICLWDMETAKVLRLLGAEHGWVTSIAWSPDGRPIVASTWGNSIRLWDAETGKLLQILQGHSDKVVSIAWSPDCQTIASASYDRTIRIWSLDSGYQTKILEGHTYAVESISFSSDGRFLASSSLDGSVRIWCFDTGEQSAILYHSASQNRLSCTAFHPNAPFLATMDKNNRVVLIWALDFDILRSTSIVTPSIRYTNARVVLVGEMSTGKTCLAHTLIGDPFKPQESTHGMKVWTINSEVVDRPKDGQIIQETLLWDLAGQTEYQIVHQLFLDKTALGIVLFDPTHPQSPFAGVEYWDKALKRVAGADCPKLLVAGRVDRGHPTATIDDIEAFRREHGFSEFIATSAKTGEGVKQLRSAIAQTIPWAKLPVTSSPELWKYIRGYLFNRRESEAVISRRSDLRESFKRTYMESEFTEEEFNTVLIHAQAQGLVWQLSFGDFVLLKPELLNNYASAIVRVARKHPHGIGCVKVRDVLEAQIDFEDMKRITDTSSERSLLHSVVELFLEKEVALREGEYLVFPSRFNRMYPEYPSLPLLKVAYRFTGPVENIYATLVVRLFYCGAFKYKKFWKNAAEFRDLRGNGCSFLLNSPNEGQGVISVFFDNTASMDSRLLFLQFIYKHLQERAISDSTSRELICFCPGCCREIKDKEAIQFRLKQGKSTIPCQYCNEQIPLTEMGEDEFGEPELLRRVRELEEVAEKRKQQEVGLTTAKAKEDIGEFDVFLAHNSKDEDQVKEITEKLKGCGLNPWLDIEQIPPGRWFQDVIQKIIPKVKSAAIIIGPKGLGKWEAMELKVFISQCVERDIPVIPVLLPGISQLPQDLLFLKECKWVHFSDSIEETEALDNLVWGITGKRPL